MAAGNWRRRTADAPRDAGDGRRRASDDPPGPICLQHAAAGRHRPAHGLRSALSSRRAPAGARPAAPRQDQHG